MYLTTYSKSGNSQRRENHVQKIFVRYADGFAGRRAVKRAHRDGKAQAGKGRARESRIIFTFVPHRKDSVALELFYLVIDVSLLFGLLALYFCQHERLGVTGLIGFVGAFIGTALIVGPDGVLGAWRFTPPVRC